MYKKCDFDKKRLSPLDDSKDESFFGCKADNGGECFANIVKL